MGALIHGPIDGAGWRRESVSPAVGASVEFVGIVRPVEGDSPIEALEYEAYEPMAEAMIGRVIEEARHRWPVTRVVVRHRLGRVPVGEPAVFIGVQAPHRQEAFAACRFLIDRIKAQVPIWKKPWGVCGANGS